MYGIYKTFDIRVKGHEIFVKGQQTPGKYLLCYPFLKTFVSEENVKEMIYSLVKPQMHKRFANSKPTLLNILFKVTLLECVCQSQI